MTPPGVAPYGRHVNDASGGDFGLTTVWHALDVPGSYGMAAQFYALLLLVGILFVALWVKYVAACKELERYRGGSR